MSWHKSGTAAALVPRWRPPATRREAAADEGQPSAGWSAWRRPKLHAEHLGLTWLRRRGAAALSALPKRCIALVLPIGAVPAGLWADESWQGE